jgi:hypothetical protein
MACSRGRRVFAHSSNGSSAWKVKRADAEGFHSLKMKTHCAAKRGLELLGLMMIGEGVVGLLFPTRYLLFWKIGPRWMRQAVSVLAENPNGTRLLCAGEIAAGLWLAAHELD